MCAEFFANVDSNRFAYSRCELIAIGNGKGCRAIEEILTHYINNKFFLPEINLKYTIVNERGASIYSCNTDEFPTLDPKLISAGETFSPTVLDLLKYVCGFHRNNFFAQFSSLGVFKNRSANT